MYVCTVNLIHSHASLNDLLPIVSKRVFNVVKCGKGRLTTAPSMSDSEAELVIGSDLEEESLTRDVESLRELLESEAESKTKQGRNRTFCN